MEVPQEVITFSVSFLVGMGGAGTYLLLLLMTDRKVEILINPLMKLRYMTVLYSIVGGFVAAIFQTATGNPIAVTSLQNVFMIGFGWQGALTGVGASGKVKEGRQNLGDSLEAILRRGGGT